MYTFLRSLVEQGEPVLPPGDGNSLKWLQPEISKASPKCIELLEKLYGEAIEEFPGTAPGFNQLAAYSGLKTLFVLCTATVFRDLCTSDVRKTLDQAFQAPEAPSEHFSADLTLHHLPELHVLISRISDADPLLDLVAHVAQNCPLSSVGLALDPLPKLDAIHSHLGLAQLHAERVIEKSDRPRSELPEVSQIITNLLGSHRATLAPNL